MTRNQVLDRALVAARALRDSLDSLASKSGQHDPAVWSIQAVICSLYAAQDSLLAANLLNKEM